MRQCLPLKMWISIPMLLSHWVFFRCWMSNVYDYSIWIIPLMLAIGIPSHARVSYITFWRLSLNMSFLSYFSASKKQNCAARYYVENLVKILSKKNQRILKTIVFWNHGISWKFPFLYVVFGIFTSSLWWYEHQRAVVSIPIKLNIMSWVRFVFYGIINNV